MFHIFLHKVLYLMCAVMKTQLLIYLLQQMGCANSIIMSVLLRDQNMFSIKKNACPLE